MEELVLEEIFLPLIKGYFDTEETKEILLSTIDHKIQFHNKKLLNHYEKTGKKHIESSHRILELKELRNKLMRFLSNADNTSFKIESIVKISIK